MPSIASQVNTQMPMTATVNGNVLQGKVSELKDGVSAAQAKEAGKGDGLDQVYIEAGGKNYVIQGEGMDIKSIEKSEMPFVQLYIGDDAVRAEVKETDNETNTFKEGLWNKGTIGGLIGVAGGAGMAVFGPALTSGPPDAKLGAVMGGMTIGAVSIGVAAIAAVGGGLYGAMNGADASQLQPLLKK